LQGEGGDKRNGAGRYLSFMAVLRYGYKGRMAFTSLEGCKRENNAEPVVQSTEELA